LDWFVGAEIFQPRAALAGVNGSRLVRVDDGILPTAAGAEELHVGTVEPGPAAVNRRITATLGARDISKDSVQKRLWKRVVPLGGETGNISVAIERR
jgi:hypothetical protein